MLHQKDVEGARKAEPGVSERGKTGRAVKIPETGNEWRGALRNKGRLKKTRAQEELGKRGDPVPCRRQSMGRLGKTM